MNNIPYFSRLLTAAATTLLSGWIASATAEAAPPDERTHLYFFGSQDYVTVDANSALSPGNDSYSWEFWARVDGDATGWNLPIEYPGGNRYYVGYNASNGWNFVVAAGGNRTDTNADSWIARITERWVFVQAVLDVENRRQTLRVFDWENDTWHEANVTPGDGPNNNTGTLYIPSPPNLYPFHGALQEIRFWRLARTKADAENDMLEPLSGNEGGLAAYWPMNEGEGNEILNRTANANHGVIHGSPRWESNWEANFEPINAPFSLTFGEGAGKMDAEQLVRNFPIDFSLDEDSLRFTTTRGVPLSSTAFAVVENYVNRQNFTLESNFIVNRFGASGNSRVGLAALGGHHSVENRFDAIDDAGFYGLSWVPAQDNGTAFLEIREGFRGTLLAEAEWNGLSPLKQEDSGEAGAIFFEDFDDPATAAATWSTGGSQDLWEIGEPVGGPGSAYSGQYVAGTGLGANGRYPANADAWIRSPVIDLSGLSGPFTLSFREFLDVDPEFDADGFFHYTSVTVLDAGLNPIAELSREAALLEDWRLRRIQLPDVALNQPIVLEFRLVSDAFMAETYEGWFIDDVAITGFEPLKYHISADGNYLPTGAMELSLTLTDQDGFSQTLTATAPAPITGDLFGFGGQLEASEQSIWEFAFEDFSFDLGTWSLPLTFGPATYAFGSDEGRAGAGNFFQNRPEDWLVGDRSLFLAPVAADPHNSLAVGQIGNFEPGNPFFTRLTTTLVALDPDPAENAVGLVLFGDADPEVFDPEDDVTFYSLQWRPGVGDSRLVFRQGMAGPVVSEINFAELDNPPVAPSATEPEAGVGGTYVFEFSGDYNTNGDLMFFARLTDDHGGEAILQGTLTTPPSGNHFGFGALHGIEGDPVWQFHRFDWFTTHPTLMPLDFAFGSASGRDGDASFFKAGMRPQDWSMEDNSLRISRHFLSGAGSDPTSAMTNVLDYLPGEDFSIRATVAVDAASNQPAFLSFDGSNDYIRVGEHSALMPMDNDYTWEFWARVSDTAGGWNLPIEYPTGDRHYVGFNAGNGWNFMLTSNGVRTDTIADRYLANFTGRWIFVQAVLDRQNHQQILRVFDPGEEIWHEAQVVPAVGMTQGSGDLFIPSPLDRFPFEGDLREMRFWQNARSRGDAENDMFQPLLGDEDHLAAYWPMAESEGDIARDESIHGNDGFFAGDPTWSSHATIGDPGDISLGHFGPFVRFDGSEDFAVVEEHPDLSPGEDNYSWEFWARIDPNATGWNLPIEYVGGNRYYVGYDANSGWNFVVTAGGNRTDTNADRSIGRIPGRWVFVQAVLDRDNQQQILRVYDPLKDAWHTAEVIPADGANDNTGILHLPSSAFRYQGDLREMRFWRKTRSLEAAADDMFERLDENADGLVGYWPMNDGSGSVMHDLMTNGKHASFSGDPKWLEGESFQEHIALSLLALGSGGIQGTATNFTDHSFLLEWLPATNLAGGELRLSTPTPETTGGRSVSRVDFTGVPDAPSFATGKSYTIELSGFFRPDGSLRLIGTLGDEHGEVDVVHHVSSPLSYSLDSWFGFGGRLPESATLFDWQTFQMGSPAQLGIEVPEFGIQSFLDWLNAHFSEQERLDPGIGGLAASPAGDGIANLLKYAFGLDPWEPALQQDLMQMEMANGQLRLTYAERHQAADVEYEPQMSPDLTLWSATDVTEVARIAHPEISGFDLVTVEADVPDEVTQAFLRILVRENQ